MKPHPAQSCTARTAAKLQNKTLVNSTRPVQVRQSVVPNDAGSEKRRIYLFLGSTDKAY